ncbi:PKS-like protein [Pseudogymnoascus sp. 24MN13]|nr:PKS-like protein [Pseudogymnoascus sp. 24MN13]
MDHSNDEPIAVVGIGCRYPGGISSATEFWEALRNGSTMMSDIPPDRFDHHSFHDPNGRSHGRIQNTKGGFISDIGTFDAEFFGYFPAEASRMDPQQRLALEASVHALEDSGIPLHQVAGSSTGVFVGTFQNDYAAIQVNGMQRDHFNPHSSLGSAACALSNRVSHRLNLQGPSITVDTACSSSLVALHLACQSIWTGESTAAIAGGVNAILRPEPSIQLSTSGFLSASGACKSFDKDADGYVRSEGVGMVFLKPLSRALKDKDRIYSLIRGSLINQDGYTEGGFAVPSANAQMDLLQSVYQRYGIDPGRVCYVEAHGSGTQIGDPIEAQALGEKIGLARSKEDVPLLIGSVKGNLGHMEGASGITGFIKAALIAFYGEVPPQANFQTPNPAINFERLRLAISTTAAVLPRGINGELIIAVNSFGAGGTNAHIVLQNAPPQPCQRASRSSQARNCPQLFTVSARSAAALSDTVKGLDRQLRASRPTIEDVSYTLNMRRSHHSEISIVAASGIEDLCFQLEQIASGGASKGVLSFRRQSEVRPKVAFVFSGQGGQWAGMGMGLAAQEPIFRQSLADFDAHFTTLSGWSIRAEIAASHDDPFSAGRTIVVQPAIAAIQIALAKTLSSYGLRPDAVVGHSVGEVAAAHISGALTLEEAVKVIYWRSLVQSKAQGKGAMLAVGLSSAELQHHIWRRRLKAQIEIAGMNGPQMTTLSGETEALQQLLEHFEQQGIFTRFIKVDVPYHSRFMDPLRDELVDSLSSISGGEANISLYSTVTASIEPGTHLTAEYWFENIRQPVKYVETAGKILKDGYGFLIEIGPHPVLVSETRRIADVLKMPANILPSMFRDSDTVPFSHLIGAAHAMGVPVDLESFAGGCGKLIDLPLYPFQRQRYWFEHPDAHRVRRAKDQHPFHKSYTRLSDDGLGVLHLRLSTGVSPFLADHVLDGAAVFPATGQAEAVFLAATKLLLPQSATSIRLQDMRFEHALVMAAADDFPPQVQLEITSAAHDFILSFRAADSSPADAWQVICRGRIDTSDSFSRPSLEMLDTVQSRIQTGEEVDIKTFYSTLERAGLRYGDAFRGVQKIWRLGNDIFGLVTLPKLLHQEASRFRIHPALLDACLHTIYVEQHYRGNSAEVYLPYGIEHIEIFDARGATAAAVHVQITCHDEISICGRINVYDAYGEPLAIMTGVRAKRVPGRSVPSVSQYDISFLPEPDNQIVKMDFENVLVLEPLGQALDCTPVIQGAFPHARVQILQRPSALAPPKMPVNLDFPMDGRSLVLIPTIRNCHSVDSAADLQLSLESTVSTLVDMANRLHSRQGIPWVIVISQGACVTPTDSQCDPFSSALQAAVRVMANELPWVRIRLVDLPLGQVHDYLPLLGDEIARARLGRDENVVALRSAGRFVKRVVPIETENKQNVMMMPARGGEYFAERDRGGSLDAIQFRQRNPGEAVCLGPDDVSIEVHAAGLNFKDAINSIGMLSERATVGSLSGLRLGLEVSGVVRDIGDNVQEIKVGSPVTARVCDGIAGHVVAHQSRVSPKPTPLDMAEAAAIPGAFVTAHYALVHLARLTRGETVLIHAAAGGVGMAAIQVAHLVGAQVYATAGSLHRQAVVAKLPGVQAVFSSRSASFRNGVKAATHGRGVDVVLNSLSGELLAESVACLAPFGRFVEIGKTDIYRNMRLGLEQFGQNCSFFVVDVDRLTKQKPALNSQIQDEVYTLLETKQLKSFPIVKFPVIELKTALTALLRSEIIGKAVVEMPDLTEVPVVPCDRLHLRGDRAYLVTGGTSGLGLHLAAFLVDRGARHLVLVSRSGPKSPDGQATIDGLQRRGVNVWVERADISCSEKVNALFAQGREWPTISGVIHCAAVAGNELIKDVTTNTFRQAFEPKAMGAWHLHEATKNMPLDFFVLISSIATLVGFPGQLSYTAANQFLNGLAHSRRLSGLPALALNYGAMGNFAGIFKNSTQDADTIIQLNMTRGVFQISLPDVLSTLERAMLEDATERMPADIDWRMFIASAPHLYLDATFMGLLQDSANTRTPESFGSGTGPRTAPEIADVLHAGLAKILGVEEGRISRAAGLERYAPDSLTLAQVRGMIQRDIRVSYPIVKLFNNPTIEDIAQELERSLNLDPAEAQSSTVENGHSHTQQDNHSVALTVISPWFIRGCDDAIVKSQPRLLCIHPMAADASFFTPYLVDPPRGLDAIAVQIPGRDNRADEPIPSSVSEIVSGLLAELDSVIGATHIIWGHSFGGIVAFEVIREMRRRGVHPLPQLLLTGTIAPHLMSSWQSSISLQWAFAEDINPDYALAVSRYTEDPHFFRSILPLFKRDSPWFSNYVFVEEEPLNVPITAFAARQDDMVYPDQVAGWDVQTDKFEFVEVDGDHWFIHKNRQVIREALERMASSPREESRAVEVVCASDADKVKGEVAEAVKVVEARVVVVGAVEIVVEV